MKKSYKPHPIIFLNNTQNFFCEKEYAYLIIVIIQSFFFHRSQQYDPSNPATNENPHWEQARKALEKTQAESNKKKANQENAVQNNAHMGVMNNPNAAYYYQQVSYFQNQ